MSNAKKKPARRSAPPSPDVLSIANRLRSCLLMLDRPPLNQIPMAKTPLAVVRGIVEEIDEWEIANAE